jgi:ABC-type transport system involved in multi-copper enzyme maturation permease subunit
LAKRELRSTIYGVRIYLAILISLIISSAILQNYLRAVSRDRMLITVSPLSYPLFIATTVCAIYLALASVTSIAREKDMQTLEVLFYGPVDHTSYILSKYLKGLLSYIFIILFLVVYFAVASITSNLGLSVKFPGVLLLSLFLSSCVITFGIFVSTLTESVRTSILLFIGIVVNAGVKWASPFYYLTEGMEAVSIGSVAKYTLSAVFSIIYSIIALVLSILVIAKKGVKKTAGE